MVCIICFTVIQKEVNIRMLYQSMRLCIRKMMQVFILAISIIPASASGTVKTVRVGWYESPFNMTDSHGRKSGYAYEYQRKIAAYTGWKYEYVEGSWAELMEMLKRGEIDLLSDVSYIEERTADILYATLPMGTEAYYIYVSPENPAILADDYTTLNGKRIGIAKGSIQTMLFADWSQMHGIQAQLIELTESEIESIRMLNEGQFDAYITLDIYGNKETNIPVCKIGSSDFYFAVAKGRNDLLLELDAAMSRIQDENKFYNQQLHEKYFKNSDVNRYLTTSEREWLMEHGTIRVGYQDNYLAFCAMDEKTGQLTGALKDYLEYASDALEETHIDFEAIVYPTAASAMEALNRGEIDCMFPANLTDFDGETLEIVMSPAIMHTSMDAVVRMEDQKTFMTKPDISVAVNYGNTNYDMFLMDNFPAWKRVYYIDTVSGLEAVAKGDADCVLISNYRFNNISRQCEKLHLTTVYTGVDMDYSLAIREGDTQLYSILSRIATEVPEAAVNAALTSYSTDDVRLGVVDIILDNLLGVMTIISLVLIVILLLLTRSIRAEKKAKAEETLVKDLNKRVYVDALTSVGNKAAFDECVKDLEAGEITDVAIGVFDCNDLKTINDQYGHDKGNIYLKIASSFICDVFLNSPVFRIGGDEFTVVLQNEDYDNRISLAERFSLEQQEKCACAKNVWEEVHVAFGIAVYDPEYDVSLHDTVRRADKFMYENKRKEKKMRKMNTQSHN